MKPSETSEPNSPKRQCWECLRRRLVCDFGLPFCKKCQKAGKECPGYDAQKPLQWVAPGKVTSRRRKPKCPSTTNAKKSHKKAEEPKLLEGSKDVSIELGALALTDEIDDLDVEDIPRSECVQEISNVLDTTMTVSLDHSLVDVPGFELTSETYDVVQAVHYYNTKVYPDLLTIGELAPNPYIIFFPLIALHYLPVSIQHTIACFALCHRIHQLPRESERLEITEKWSKVYYHRGIAIREMSEMIGRDSTRCSDGTISSVCLFLCMELLQSTTQNWQNHADGLMKLINMRGGILNYYRANNHMRPVLVTTLLIIIFGNSTSPPASQIPITACPDALLSFVVETYDIVFPHCLVPPSLFLDLISINGLRTQTLSLTLDPNAAREEAEELLARIEAFSPEDWAQPNTSFHEEWLHIGTVYQSAIAVYCISSLQSLSILPKTARLDAIRASHGDRLFISLKAAVASWRVRKFMLWPLVVAGVEALNHSVIQRSWVEAELREISKDIGSSSPLKARSALREYWRKGKRGWDECFDCPYAFIV